MLAELMQQRRSVRKYLAEAPPLTLLEEIVNCGRTAPSPSNRQPVRVRRVASEAARGSLQAAMARQRDLLLDEWAASGGPKRMRNHIRVYYRFSEFMFSAPWLLLVGTVPTAPGFGDLIAASGLRRQDDDADRNARIDAHKDADITVGLTVAAMLLRATELDLASCVLTAPLVFLAPEKDLAALAGMTPKCFITLGYGAETPPPTPRLPLDQIMEHC